MIVIVKCDIKILFFLLESGERVYGDFLLR